MVDADLQRFRRVVEQLQLIGDLIRAKTPVQTRAAIILADSLIDSLMYRRATSEFQRQSAMAVIRRPEYNLEKQQKVRREFSAKLTLMSGIGVMEEQDAAVVRIAHSFRNAAYHRDSHNERVSESLARIIFTSAVQLFTKYFDNGVSFGGAKQGWLAPYGVNPDLFSMAEASTAISSQLLDGMEVELEDARSCLHEDVRERLEAIDRRIAALDMPIDALDEGMKLAEFEQLNPFESFSSELRELNYRILAGEGDSVSRDAYRAAETLARSRFEEALAQFVPTASTMLLKKVRESRRLLKAENSSALLLAYEELDGHLGAMEGSLEQVEEAVDRAIQHQEDVRRGK